MESLQKKELVEESEPLFEPFTTEMCPNGISEVPIKYFDIVTKEAKERMVTLKFSIVKEKIYDLAYMTCQNPGNTRIGKFVGALEGISVVREGRELDFGEFGFYSDKNNPYHRRWGVKLVLTEI